METYEDITETAEVFTRGVNKGQTKQPIKTPKVKLNFKMYKKEGLEAYDYTILTDRGGWEDTNDLGKNKRTNTPEDMGIIPHEGITWKIADNKRNKSIKEKDIYFTAFNHTDELNIIGTKNSIKTTKSRRR